MDMGWSALLGIAKELVRSPKFKIAAVGLQLAYFGSRYASDKRKKQTG